MEKLNYEEIAASVEIELSEPIELPVEDILPSPAPEVRQPLPRITDEKYQGLGAEKGYSQDYSRIQKMRYSHEAMVDVIIARPSIAQNELAVIFERRPAWISRIIGSDAFQGALAKRREELSDPFLVATMEERFRGLASQSIDILAEKLELTKNADIALKALDISSKALGFGARSVGGGQIQNNFVVQLPNKIASAEVWAEKHVGGKILEG